MLEACELNSVSEEDYIDLGKAGLGSCLLAGLPHWLIAYSARLVCFCSELIIDYHSSFLAFSELYTIIEGEIYQF